VQTAIKIPLLYSHYSRLLHNLQQPMLHSMTFKPGKWSS